MAFPHASPNHLIDGKEGFNCGQFVFSTFLYIIAQYSTIYWPAFGAFHTKYVNVQTFISIYVDIIFMLHATT